MNTPRTRHASRREFVLATLGASALAATGRLFAQNWPERPITFICPWPAGGTADQSMRALCTVAGKLLGQPIAVENRAGASGMIGAKALASARADGYTIGQIPISVTRFSQLGSLQADPRKDYTYIARTSGQTFGIAVPAHSPFKTLKDFVAAAKARPGQVTYAHAGVGGATHVGMEEFAGVAGIQLNHVPYKGGAEALQGVLGGHVDALADSSSWAPCGSRQAAPAGHLGRAAHGALQGRAHAARMRLRRGGRCAQRHWRAAWPGPGRGGQAARGLSRRRGQPRVQVRGREAGCAAAVPGRPGLREYVNTVYQKETVLIDKLKLRELMKG